MVNSRSRLGRPSEVDSRVAGDRSNHVPGLFRVVFYFFAAHCRTWALSDKPVSFQ